MELEDLKLRFAREQDICGRRHSEVDDMLDALERAERVEAAARHAASRHAEMDPDDPAVHLAMFVLRRALADPNGEPKDDKPPKDQPEPRPPSPNATLGELVIACQSAQEVLGELAFVYVPAGALLRVLDRIPELQGTIDEALNALDADMPLVAATTLLGATRR